MIISKALRDSAGHHDAYCTLQIAGVCGDATAAKTAGCVLCHWRLPGDVGGAQKPDDLTAGFGCGPCHRAMDSNGTTHGVTRGSQEWYAYAMRAMVRTQRFWVENGYLTVKGMK